MTAHAAPAADPGRWSGYKLPRDPRVQALLAAADPVKPGTGYNGYAAIEALGRLAFASVLDFAVVRPDRALAVDLARMQRDRASAIREVTSSNAPTPPAGPTASPG